MNIKTLPELVEQANQIRAENSMAITIGFEFDGCILVVDPEIRIFKTIEEHDVYLQSIRDARDA